MTAMDKSTMLRNAVSWQFLSAIWNITGAFLISQGLQALRPTASWATAAVLLVLRPFAFSGGGLGGFLF